VPPFHQHFLLKAEPKARMRRDQASRVLVHPLQCSVGVYSRVTTAPGIAVAPWAM
jgi:hypothetical protein